MKLSDFTYDLPDELIAKYPANKRTQSKLLLVNQQQPMIAHRVFKDILEQFNPGDLLVLNNTKVIPARFFGKKITGGKLEFLLERVLDNNQALVYIKANRAPKLGLEVEVELDVELDGSGIEQPKDKLNNKLCITILEKQQGLYLVKLNGDCLWYELLAKIGQMPLPPYITRGSDSFDEERYQTVYAKHLGAVAAPTAGLHFDKELLSLLKKKGVKIQYITLHVGAGTFSPVRVDNIKEHKMHSEVYSVEQELIDSIIELKAKNNHNPQKNKLVAVGTTSLRCLESLANSLPGVEEDYSLLNQSDKTGETDIFIYPGFKFKLVDSLVTNFHLPGSTLMMLVSAFAGMQEIKHAYQMAIDKKYRFYSYGDAMWLNRKV